MKIQLLSVGDKNKMIHITCTTIKEYVDILDATHIHSEYDTDYADLTREIRSADNNMFIMGASEKMINENMYSFEIELASISNDPGTSLLEVGNKIITFINNHIKDKS